ncbi:SMI1/KNR4 family protein [Mycobacteroides chelonae]|uniref:SMI1/KNR4 family protein n=1 Tax=Mycobacteroides chelonae TaxID=1774 RepID=UPI0008A8477F|nr:SMI1/KNR4 family protein [Mycobacteroides chelonae]MBV0916844.1 SMI1/KNR4 family protein [Mycobacteroides chelonae]OHT82159.1 hypothetical protein BKG69_02740 [Mycobacteroides chelonae]
MNPLIVRLEAALAAVHPEFLAAQMPGASDEQVDRLEALAGKPIPATLRDLLTWRNGVKKGGVLVSFAGPWSFMSVEAIIEAVDMLRDLLRCEEGWEEQTWWGHGWIPFLEDGFGDHLCVDLDGGGNLVDDGEPFIGMADQIIQFDHAAELRVIKAPSFDVWLTAFVEAVEEGILMPVTERLGRGMSYSLDAVDDGPDLSDVLGRLAPGYPRYLTCPVVS